MAKKPSTPVLTVSKEQARRFLVGYHRLAPPRKLAGKPGALKYIRQVNCIQYDPINIVGQNPHLVLQSRVRNYQPRMLDELLYADRSLVDGFDKVMSIYPSEDWAYFHYYRSTLGGGYTRNPKYAEAARLMERVRKELEQRGPLSSLELEEDSRVFGGWGTHMRAARVALDMLFFTGEVVVHHRVGSRRYFDLTRRALGKLHKQPNPHPNPEAYLDWHVLRRVRSLGLARSSGTEQWYYMMKAAGGRPAALKRLLAGEQIMPVHIDGWAGQTFYIHPQDKPALQRAAQPGGERPGAAFIAPLDNLVWDRALVEKLFGFHYRWEVYVPQPKRKYGYYVLPVLYGERFVARMDSAFDRAGKTLAVNGWWWERDVKRKDAAMLAALGECLRDFARYLGAEDIRLGEKAKRDTAVKAILKQAHA